MGFPRVEIRQGHVLPLLKAMPSESVQVCVTSPPYWGLRTYGTDPEVWGGDGECCHEWESKVKRRSAGGETEYGSSDGGVRRADRPVLPISGLCSKCGAWRGELGLEPTMALYIEHIVDVFREVKRVLRKDGTLWLNIGDSYVAGPTGHQDISSTKGKTAAMFDMGGRYRVDNLRKDAAKQWGGLSSKNLCMIPARVAIALQEDGWILRSEITWCKRAPMPDSAKDRPSSATEKIFLFSRSKRYFYDADALRVKGPGSHMRGRRKVAIPGRKDNDRPIFEANPRGRNGWNYWVLGPDPFPAAHFATFPREIPRRCILAGSREGDVALDLFCGSGTTGVVALALGRSFIGLELSPEYVEMSKQRIYDSAPLLAYVAFREQLELSA